MKYIRTRWYLIGLLLGSVNGTLITQAFWDVRLFR